MTLMYLFCLAPPKQKQQEKIEQLTTILPWERTGVAVESEAGICVGTRPDVEEGP